MEMRFLEQITHWPQRWLFMNLPKDFVHRMRAVLGEDADAFFDGYNVPLRRGLRVNTLKCDVSRFGDLFPHPLSPSPFAKDAFYLDAEHKAGADPLHHAGAYYMQEPSAASAVTALAPQKGEHVLDLCAAPGGKSTQIAAAVGEDGFVWCNEYVRARAQILAQNIERLGIRHAVVSNSDTAPLCQQLEGCFDAVLADVPCSGEGMFRKEPVALTQWSEQLVTECAVRGEQILHNASLAVRDGGRIVYSTCTFAPEENELQIARFLKAHPHFTLVDCGVVFGRAGISADKLLPFDPSLDTSLPLEKCRRIFPSDGGEGHFIALLVKNGNQPRREIKEKTSRPSPLLPAVQKALSEWFTEPPKGELAVFNDTVRLIPKGMPAVKNVPLVYVGCPVGTVAKNRIEPHHALFISSDPSHCRQVVALDGSDRRIAAFLHGEEIEIDPALKGYAVVTIHGIPCGFGKAVSGTLKNRYPKGLRTL